MRYTEHLARTARLAEHVTAIRTINHTLGIEHEGQPSVLWTSAMEDASTKLVYDLCKKYDIPIDADHIIRHHEIYDLHNCPGPCWDKQTYIDKVKSYGA